MGRLHKLQIESLLRKYRVKEIELAMLNQNLFKDNIEMFQHLAESAYYSSRIEYEETNFEDLYMYANEIVNSDSFLFIDSDERDWITILSKNCINFHYEILMLIERKTPITPEIIQFLHKLLTNQMDKGELWKPGKFRNYEATISGKENEVRFTTPTLIEIKVKELCEEIEKYLKTDFESNEKALNETLKLKAKFIKIHPFGDGNGRVGRGLFQYLLGVKNLRLTTFNDWNREDYHNGMYIAYKTNGSMNIIKKMYLDEVLNWDLKPLLKIDWE